MTYNTFTVAYDPPISTSLHQLLADQPYSMESYDGTSHQYTVDLLAQLATTVHDIALVDELIANRIDYIEI